MDINAYILAIVEANPGVSVLKIGQGAFESFDASALPEGITAEAWDEEFCVGLNDAGENVVVFRV